MNTYKVIITTAIIALFTLGLFPSCTFASDSEEQLAVNEKAEVNESIDSEESVETENVELEDAIEMVDNEGAAPNAVKPHRVWSVKSSSYQGITANGQSWHQFDKQPMKKGAYYTLKYSSSYKGTISGELKVTKAQIEAKLGFDYSKSESFSKSYTEQATKNCTGYGYYKKQYKKYKVVQVGKLTPGKADPIYKTVYVYKPAPPQLKIEFK